MLHALGLLTQGNEGLIPYAIRLIKKQPIDFHVAADFKKTFSRECKPHFVGVWDTVSSVGWVYNAVRFPFTTAARNPDLAVIRHAVSIDERRAFFSSKPVWRAPWSPARREGGLVSGVHSDVGGSYPEPESQLSKIALRWMVCEAELAGISIDPQRKADILGASHPMLLLIPLPRTSTNRCAGGGGLRKSGRRSSIRKLLNILGESLCA